MSNDKTDDNERFTTSDEDFQTQEYETASPDSPLSTGKKSEIDKGTEKKKSSNQNKILFGCCAVAIAGYLGYVFLLKPTPVQVPPPRPIGAVNNPVEQVPQPQVPQVQAPVQQLPQVQPQASTLPNLNPSATVAPTQVPSVVPPVSQTPITPTTTPSVIVQTTPPVLESNVTTEDEDTVSRKEYDDLKNQVEKLEVKLNDMSSKLSSTAEAHAEYVAKFDKFVTVFGEKLDARFAEYDKKISELVDRMTELEKQLEEKKAPPKPAARPNPAPRPQAAKPAPKANPDVLIDREGDAKVSVNVPKANVTVAPKPVVAVKAENSLPVTAKEVKLPSLNVHALVDGRFWIKKTDGTIESYKVGDKLPTGEVVNEVYKKKDGNYIVTDKRTIND